MARNDYGGISVISDEEREAFEYQLQEIQSHVTRSLKKTDAKLEDTKKQLNRTEKKLDLILKHLELESGQKVE